MFLKLKNTLLLTAAFTALTVFYVSCTSSKVQTPAVQEQTVEVIVDEIAQPKAILEKQPERMFWKITGTDKNGNPSAIYIQGTFHFADEKCYPFSEAVLNAFTSSDRIFAEISTEGNKELEAKMPEIYQESFTRANGRLLSEKLSEADFAYLKQLIGDNLADYCNSFEPWVLNTILDVVIYSFNGFSIEYGIETYFNKLAESSQKNVEGLDTVDCQIEAITFGTYEQQFTNLLNTLEQFKNLEEIKQKALDFYQAYLDGDIQKFESIGFTESDETLTPEEIEYNELYNQKLIIDRNEKWAKTFEDLLYEGGTTFVYAGALHFVGEYSVFKYMEEKGSLKIN